MEIQVKISENHLAGRHLRLGRLLPKVVAGGVRGLAVVEHVAVAHATHPDPKWVDKRYLEPV